MISSVEKYSVCYIRVSSTDQVDGFSPDFQLEYCLKKATDSGYTNIKEFSDLGISAKDTNRPGLQALLSFVTKKSNKVSTVFIYSYSRLNRNTVDFLSIKLLLSKCGVNIISCTEPSQQSPEGDFIQTMLSAVAELDNKTKARIVSNGMHKRFLSGYCNGNPPIGFRLEKIDGKVRQVADPVSYETVRKTWYRIKEEKLSLTEVTKIWNNTGLKTHEKRFKRWTKQSLSKVFSNKFYIGFLQSRTYPEEPRGVHPAMITEELFYEVRTQITGKSPNNTERRSRFNEEFPVKGILRCELCADLNINRKSTAAFSKGKREKFPYYFCSSRGLHKNISYRRKLIEDKFLELLRRTKPKPNLVALFMETLREKYYARIDILKDSGKYVVKEIKELEETLSTLKYKHLKGIYDDEEYIKIRDELKNEIVVKQGLVSEKKLDMMDIKTLLNFMQYYLTHLDECFVKASLEGKLVIACSIFPSGLLFDKEDYRTPELGFAYSLNYLSEINGQSLHARRDSNPRPKR